jgi:hypothetical protein
MKRAAAGLLVGCVLLMALAPASAAFSVRKLIGLEDANSEEGSANSAILPVGMDLGKIQTFLQSVVTGASVSSSRHDTLGCSPCRPTQLSPTLTRPSTTTQ